MFFGCRLLNVIDLSSFNTNLVTDMGNMFNTCNVLKEVFVSDSWSTQAVTSSPSMFTGCYELVGGNGTAYGDSYTDATYARIDKPGEPGYFTYKRFISRDDEFLVKYGTMVDIAEAIRSKTGSTDSLTPSQMVEAVAGIDTSTAPEITVSSGGLITATSGSKSNTKQMTAQAAKTVTPTTSEQTAVASGVYTTGAVKVAAMPTATQATPSVSIDSAGKITATATQTAGYVTAGTKTGTKQLTTQAAKTVTPSTSDQAAVASGVYTTGAVTVKGDSNLKAENIAEGVSIFGVAGAFAGAGEEWMTLKSGTTYSLDGARGCLVLAPSTSATTFESLFMYLPKGGSLAVGSSPSYSNYASISMSTDFSGGSVTDVTFTTKTSYKTAYALIMRDTPL
jgi:surface protein